MKNRWNENELKTLIENYATLGAEACAKKLNRTEKSVTMKSHRLSLKLSDDKRSKIVKNSYIHKNNFKSELIERIDINFAYILGFIWADGFADRNFNNVKISCVIEDIIEIEDIFHSTGNWLSYIYKYNNYRTQKVLSISDKILHQFLVDNDYLVKSEVSPTKILNKIPIELHRFFLLGLIDGDGCFYWNEKRKLRQFSITGTHIQDWSSIENLLNSIGIINHHIVRRKNSKSSSSYIRVTNRLDISTLGHYIYDGHKLGLQRKRNIYYNMV